MRRKDIDEMELSFEDINKGSVGKIIFFIILLLLLIGGISYYYFIFDSPKRIFLTSTNKLIEKTNIEAEGLNKDIDYKIDLNFISNNKEEDQSIKTYLDIINELTIEGYHREKNDTYQENMLINYKDKLLLDGALLLKDENNAYLKINNLYDKVIHLPLEDLTTEDEKDTSKKENNAELEDYKIVINNFIKHLTDTMKNANYKKTYTKLNDQYVKKITLLCDKEFNSMMYDKLIHDEEFIKSYAKINSQTEEEIIDEFNEEISLLEDYIEEISLYLTIFDNKFIMLEDDAEDDYFKVEKNENKYYYEYTEDNNLLTKGYVEYQVSNNKHFLTLSLEDTKEQLIIESDIEYTFDTKDIENLNTESTIKYEAIPEADLTKIITSLTENDAFKQLIQDIESKSSKKEVPNKQI